MAERRMFEKTIIEGFMSKEQNDLFRVFETIDELIYEITNRLNNDNKISKLSQDNYLA